MDVLSTRAYIDGTRYYDSAECFLYFLSRLLRFAPQASELHNAFGPLLLQRTLERVGTAADPIAIAMRILICAQLGGVIIESDLSALRALQCIDGGWPIGYVYRMGSSAVRIGSRGLATAMALKAIRAVQALPSPSALNAAFLTSLSLRRLSWPVILEQGIRASSETKVRHRRGLSIGDASRWFTQRFRRRSIDHTNVVAVA
jgi:hypothetical protein